jgi:hypothetical protein
MAQHTRYWCVCWSSLAILYIKSVCNRMVVFSSRIQYSPDYGMLYVYTTWIEHKLEYLFLQYVEGEVFIHVISDRNARAAGSCVKCWIWKIIIIIIVEHSQSCSPDMITNTPARRTDVHYNSVPTSEYKDSLFNRTSTNPEEFAIWASSHSLDSIQFN